jgi:hypothetical protein
VSVPQRMRKALVRRMLENRRNACYVLITCSKPSKDGKMEVELTYDGDLDLASYLVHSAQGYLDDQTAEPGEEAIRA